MSNNEVFLVSRNEPLSHGPSVWVPAVQDRSHLQGGDPPGQKQGCLQRTVHGLLPGARQAKGNPRTPRAYTHVRTHKCVLTLAHVPLCQERENFQMFASQCCRILLMGSDQRRQLQNRERERQFPAYPGLGRNQDRK